MRPLFPLLLLCSLACHQPTQTITQPSGSPAVVLSGPPAKLVLPELEAREIPEGVWLGPGRAYPLGWSPGGLFAYAYEPADEACGCYFFELIIQDMVNDKILWDYKYTSDEFNTHSADQLTNLAEMWRAHGEEFEAKLSTFGIVRSQDAPVVLPQSGPAPLSVVFQTTLHDEEEVGFSTFSSCELKMLSAKGQKTILKSGELSPGLLEVSSPGYIKSPFEPRIAVVIQEVQRGWEGPPSVVALRFSGCDLEHGWH